MPGTRRQAATRGRTRRRVRKNIAIGQAHIKTSFNNTIVALTDREGMTLFLKGERCLTEKCAIERRS